MTKKQYLPPMYLQIKEILKERIISGEYLRGQKLPSERELSQIYDISRMTARSALSELVKEGLAFRNHGSGTFVAYPKIDRDLIKLTGFSQMLRDKGIKPSNKLLRTRKIEADKNLSSIFNVFLGTIFYEIVRIRYGNDIPLAIEYTHVPEKEFPGLLDYDFNKESLYKLFESHYKRKISYAKQWLSLYQVNNEEAKNLDIPEETSVILFESITYDTNDIPMEFTKSLSRGDRCIFHTELRK